MIYSQEETCNLHQLNPYTWLKDVLIRLPNHPTNKITELLAPDSFHCLSIISLIYTEHEQIFVLIG